VARFVDRFATALTEAGFPRMAARVFVTLLSTDLGRSTAAELMETLQASAGAVSGAVRYLLQVDLIEREHEPGSRKDHYRIRDDVWLEATVRRDKMLAKWDATLGEGISAVGEQTAAGARLSETRAFFSFVQTELPALLDRWHECRTGVRREQAAATVAVDESAPTP
jgi:DNA-binding transcriptional regulator GbsR (MarR family)